MNINFEPGKFYVCQHGNVWKCEDTYSYTPYDDDLKPREYVQFSRAESFNSDCSAEDLDLKNEEAQLEFISEYRGMFTEEQQLINWKHPDQPGYMEFVKPPVEEKPAEKVGHKNDNGKPMFSCLPPDALMELGKVAALGATKYGLHNYRNGIQVSRLLDAAFRHLIAAINGEDADKTDGNNHLASVAWNALAALQILKDKPELDDRYKG